IRVSKSTIVNVKKIKSIQRGISSIREIEFHNSQKSVYVSRKYYPLFRDKMEERSI
ncbi:MAG: LytTR family transcriptional regulator, partial [Fastidiosipila sp.]|nr:LytTR family transcriptional regulator [Fastidiosipila sp.]